MSIPLITVLMTVYNGGIYLKASIESILRQTFSVFEFLIINDCSRDESVVTIESYKDKRIRLVHNETNMGQTPSLNKGLALARGRYIARMDADDLAFPSWLETNLALLQDDPLTALVSCRAIVIDGKNRIQKTLSTPKTYGEMVLRSLLATPVNHVGAVFKTDVITSVGGYDPRYRIAADFGLWSELIRRRIRLASTERTLVAVRVHEESASVIERGRIDIPEISAIMAGNFKALVSFAVSQEDIFLLWKLNYATEQLTTDEFHAALALLHKAYGQINPDFFIPIDIIQNYGAHLKKVFFAKRALGEIVGGHLGQLRALTRDYRKSEGWFNIFTLLWLGSWLGKPIVKQLPNIYENWRVWSARRKVQQQACPELIH